MKKFLFLLFVVFTMDAWSQIKSETDGNVWGDWEVYQTCSSSDIGGNTYIWETLFMCQYPSEVELMKRTDENGNIEFKLVNLFGTEDFIMSYDSQKDKVYWSKTETKYVVPSHIVPPSFKPLEYVTVNAGYGEFHPKRGLKMNLFFMCMETQTGQYYGYNTYNKFISPTVVSPSYSIYFHESHPNSEYGIIRANSENYLTHFKYVVVSETNRNTSDINNYLDYLKGYSEKIPDSEWVVAVGEMDANTEVYVPFEKTGYHIVYVVGYDNDGDWLTQTSKGTFATLIDGENWVKLGKGRMVEPEIANAPYTNGFEPILDAQTLKWLGKEYEVDVEMHRYKTGLFRVVNPLGENTPFEDFSMIIPDSLYQTRPYLHKREFIFDRTSGKQYYIIIHAEEPNDVWCEYSLLGANFIQNDSGVLEDVTTSLYYSLYNISPCCLELVDNVIKTKDEYKSAYQLNGAKFYFELQLPENSKLEDIDNVIDNLPPQYYDINGHEVETPRKGFYIVKKGNKVFKKINH